MYRIVAYDSPTETTGHVVFDPRINRYISDGKLELLESEIDRLTLTVNQMNYLFGDVRPLQTHIEVYQDNSLLFRGRALDLTREMKDSGQFVQSFVFESIQNYLQDTSQRWAKVQNTTPKQFFQRLINTHNSQVPDYKKFTVRNVDVTNSTDNVYRYIEDGATTWDTIKDKLVSRLGGFIRVEYVDGVNYIDYLQNPGKDHPNDTPIQIAKNLQSASVQVDPTEVITQLVPLGATIEQNETNPNPDTQVSQPRIDIKSVNGGKDYLDIPDLQAEFGIIRKSVQWDDVHEPAILLTKAKQWIQAQSSAKESWTVDALELPEFNAFTVSDRYSFVQPNITTPKMLRVTGKTVDFANPNKSTLTIGDRQDSLTAYQLENMNQRKQAQKYNAQSDSQSAALADLTGKYDGLVSERDKFKNQMADMQAKIDALNGRNRNLIIAKYVVSGALSNDGSIIDEIGYITTAFIEVVAGDDYTATIKPDDDYLQIAEYDLNKDFIQLDDDMVTITTGASTRYVRLTFKAESYGEPYKFEHGSTATPWSPAPED